MDASALFVSVPSFARHVAYGYAPPSADAEDTEDIPRLRVFVAGGADGVDVKGIATRLRNLGHIPLPFWLDAESSSDDRGGSDGDGRDGDKDKNKDADTDEDTDKDARRAWLSMRALRGAHHLLAVLSDDANPCVNAAAEIGAFLALRRESHVWIVDACGPRAAHRANVYLKDPMARLHVWGNVDALLRDMDAKHARSVPVPLLRVRADRRSKSVHDHVAARVVEDGIGGGATLEVRMPQATHARGEGRILAAATTDSRDYVFVARASDEGGLARGTQRMRRLQPQCGGRGKARHRRTRRSAPRCRGPTSRTC